MWGCLSLPRGGFSYIHDDAGYGGIVVKAGKSFGIDPNGKEGHKASCVAGGGPSYPYGSVEDAGGIYSKLVKILVEGLLVGAAMLYEALIEIAAEHFGLLVADGHHLPESEIFREVLLHLFPCVDAARAEDILAIV